MAIKSSVKRRKRIAFWILFIFAFLWILPLLWALATSFKSSTEITTNVIGLFPRKPTFENYVAVFSNFEHYPILRWILNSAIVSVIYTTVYLIIAAMAAYAFSILKWKYRDLIFGLVLSTMMIPTVVNIIPLFSMAINLKWLDSGKASFLAYIVPGLGGVFGMFVIRQFFTNIPLEIVESARMDGLSNWQIFWRIILPLGKSSVMVAGLFAFLGSWNDYLWPSIIGAVIQDKNFYTLQVGLATMQSANNYAYGFPMAGAIISIIPVIIVYIAIQDKIIEGVAFTGSK